MNFCPECGCHLDQVDLKAVKCRYGHPLPIQAPATAHPVLAEPKAAAVRQDTGPKDRKLPATPEEREEAYQAALDRLCKFFEGAGFTSYVVDNGTLMVGKGSFLLDVKVVDNDGRTAYVTSNPSYNPAKAGTKESRATIITSRKVMKTQRLLRVSVSGTQTLPIFVELDRQIPDPEAHVCKTVLFILEEACKPGSRMNTALKDTSFLKDVPAEWRPQVGEAERIFGLPGSGGQVCIPEFPK